MFDQIGTTCSDYADHLDAAHHAVTSTLVALLAAVAGTQIVGAVASLFSFGVAELPTQAGTAAEVETAAAEVDTTLGVLTAEAAATASEADTAVAADDVAAELQPIENASAERAATAETGPSTATGPATSAELSASERTTLEDALRPTNPGLVLQP